MAILTDARSPHSYIDSNRGSFTLTRSGPRRGLLSSPSLRPWLCLLLTAATACPLAAGDALRHLPADVPGFVVFPNLARSNERLTEFIRQFNPDYEAIDLDAFGQDVNLTPGAWDPNGPVVLIMTRPEFSKASLLVAFKPRDMQQLVRKAGLKDDAPGRYECPIGRSWLVVKGQTAFAGQKLSTLRIIKEVPSEASIAAVLDQVERQMLDEGDVFGRLTLSRWREKFNPYVLMGINAMRLGVTAETDPEQYAATQSLMNWFIGGMQSVIDQMATLSFSAGYDGTTLRFTHHHRFTPGKSVADYLGSVKNDGTDLMATLPDVPFWMAATSNWHLPPGASLTARVTEHVMTLPELDGKLNAAKRREIVRIVRDCYGQIRGSTFMISAPKGSLFPMQMLGSYVMDDAVRGLKEVQFIGENASKTMSLFMPGTDLKNKFTEKREGDIAYSEMPMDVKKLNEKMRREISLVYGENVRHQYAVLSPNEVVYCLAEPPMSVVQLITSRRAKASPITERADVRRLLSRLPENPNSIVIVDVNQLFCAVPSMIQRAEQMQNPGKAAPATEPAERDPSPSALLGWAGTVGPGRLTGCLAIDAEEAVQAVESAKGLAIKMKKAEASAK